MIVFWFLGWLVLITATPGCAFAIVGGSIYALRGAREGSRKKKVIGIWMLCVGLAAAFPLGVLYHVKFFST